MKFRTLFSQFSMIRQMWFTVHDLPAARHGRLIEVEIGLTATQLDQADRLLPGPQRQHQQRPYPVSSIQPVS